MDTVVGRGTLIRAVSVMAFLRNVQEVALGCGDIFPGLSVSLHLVTEISPPTRFSG
jgi:hypothetical protein